MVAKPTSPGTVGQADAGVAKSNDGFRAWRRTVGVGKPFYLLLFQAP